MSEHLSNGWVVATLPDLAGDAGLMTDGDWVETEDQDPFGEIRLIQLADVGDGLFKVRSQRFLTEMKSKELRCTILKPGDVLIARMPDPLGRACVFPGLKQLCCTVADVCILRPGDDGISTRWLMYFLNAPQFRIPVSGLRSGSTRKRISRKNLATVPLAIPPKEEQRRIADALDSYLTRLNAAAGGLAQVESKLERYRAALLKAAVEGHLVLTEADLANKEGRDYEPASALLARILRERRLRWEETELAKMRARGAPPANDTWKSKYEEPVGPDASCLPTLPKGWCWATLDALLKESPQNGLYVPKEIYGNGTPILRINDFQSLRCVPAKEMRRVAIDRDTARNYELRVRDIVINRVNAPSHLGKCISVDANTAGAVFESNMIRATPTDNTSSDYVCLYLSSLDGKARLTTNAKWAVSQASIKQRDVRATPVPLPPLQEQIRISEEVSRLLVIGEHLGADVGRGRLACGRLRQAVLKWAFEGKLVDQDSADEPASMLLDRARQEAWCFGTRTKRLAGKPARETA